MNLLISRKLEIASAISFTLFFIINFIDRSIGNIFLLTTLIMSIINYNILYQSIKSNINLFISIVLFSTYITLSGIYHGAPMNQLDNYFRFLLLLPLLVITLKERHIIIMIFACAIMALVFAFYNNAFFSIVNYLPSSTPLRYSGSSSVSITYGTMCSTLFLVTIYYIFYKQYKSWQLIFSAVIFLAIFFLTGTRGPVIGIIVGLTYLSLVLIRDGRQTTLRYFYSSLLILFLSLMIIPNPLFDRLKLITQIDYSDVIKIEHTSLRERLYMLNFGIEKFKNSQPMGIGPQNMEHLLKKSIDEQNINNVTAYDHLHNDFLDIALKFGVISLVLLLFIYFYLLGSKNNENRVLIFLVIIMLVSTQTTQSHFAHHQAITFFISLLYLLQNKA